VDCRQVRAASTWEATTEPSTRSVSRWSTKHRVNHMKHELLFVLFSANLWAQLPEGPGREETERLCQSCHDLARSVSLRQDRAGWQATLNKMVAFGTKGTDGEFALILDYLAKHFPAEELPPVNVNKAAAIEL